MATQDVDFKVSPDSDTNDTGNPTSTTAIKPLIAGERVRAAVLNRPHENLRQRTETLRTEVSNLKYLMDSDISWIITGGDSVGAVVGDAQPTVTWDYTTGKFVTSANIVVQPIAGPITDKSDSVTYTSGVLWSITLGMSAKRFAGGHLKSISWTEVAPAVLAPARAAATITYTPYATLNIQICNDGTTLVSDIHAVLNPIGEGFSHVITGSGVVSLSDITPLTYLFDGVFERELHYITPAVFATFFAIPNSISSGDTLCINYEWLVDPTISTFGGRRQATPTANGGAINTVVSSGQLFLANSYPERLPLAIPICRRIGDALIFVDGTVCMGTPPYVFPTTVPFGVNQRALDLVATAIAEATVDLTNALAADTGASTIGVAAHITTGGTANITNGSLQAVLNHKADEIDAHIVDSAGAHAASAVSTSAIIGHTYSVSAGGSVQAALSTVMGGLNVGLNTQDTSNPWCVTTAIKVRSAYDSASEENWVDQAHPSFEGDLFVHHLRGGMNYVGRSSRHLTAKQFMPGSTTGVPWDANNSKFLNGEAIAAIAPFCRALPQGHPTGTDEYISRMIVVATATEGSVASGQTGPIKFIDPMGMYDVITKTPSGLPTVAGSTWKTLDMVVDCDTTTGVNTIYLLCQNAASAPDTYRVQAYTVSIACTLSVKTGWPLTGVAPAGGVGGSVIATFDRCRLIPAGWSGNILTSIASINGWIPITAADSPAITVFSTATGAVGVNDNGKGDMPYSATCHVNGGACSDGTYIYYGGSETGHSYLASALISNVKAVTGRDPSSLFPYDASAIGEFNDVAFDGYMLWAVHNTEGLFIFDVSVLDPANDVVTRFDPPTGCPTLHRVCVDGVNAWIVGFDDITTHRIFIWKLPLSTQGESASGTTFNEFADKCYLFTPREVAALPPSQINIGRPIYDGSDVWIMADNGRGSLTANSSTLRRIVSSCFR